MNKKEDFLIGLTIGGLLILLFYILLFFPIVWIYLITPTDYRDILKYLLAVLFTLMLVNSAKAAYESFKLIKSSDKIYKIINDKKDIMEESLLLKGFKYRIELEFSFLM